MDKKHIKEAIYFQLETIIEQANTISEYNQNIPQIELDIILDNIRKLYEQYTLLKKCHTDVTPSLLRKEECFEKDAQNDISEKDELEKAEKELKQTEHTYPNPPIEKPATHLVDKQIKEPDVKKNIVPETPIIENKINKPDKSNADLFSNSITMSEKFKSDETSINEKISKLIEDKTIYSKIKKTPIKDLKAAIGINEKFRFINELFDGDLANYNEAISKLNNFENIEQAVVLLDELKEKNNWEMETPSFIILSELVGRRYL